MSELIVSVWGTKKGVGARFNFFVLVKEVRDILRNAVRGDGCEFNLERTGEAAAGVGLSVVREIVDDWLSVKVGVINLNLIVQTPCVVCHVKDSKRKALRELLELECVRVGFWGEPLGKLCLHVLQGLEAQLAQLCRGEGLLGERAHLLLFRWSVGGLILEGIAEFNFY